MPLYSFFQCSPQAVFHLIKYIFIFWGCFCTFFVIIVYIKSSQANKLQQRFDNRDYGYIISRRKQLLKAKNKNPSNSDNNLLMLAVAYFETGDDENFLACVNQISHPEYINRKIHMQALHAIVTQNGHFPMLRDALCKSPYENEKYISVTNLDCIMELCYNPDCDTENHKAFIEVKKIFSYKRVWDFVVLCRNNMKEGL